MGLVGGMLGRVINAGAWMAELIYEIADRPLRLPPVIEEETLITEEPPTSQGELQVCQQWGLRLPSGDIQWNMWQGIPFGNPLDRLKMVATLQQTAIDLGLPFGEQTDAFLSKYQWTTRNQFATVTYEDTGTFALSDPHVSALESSHDNENSTYAAVTPAASNGHHPDVELRPGPVGGDA